MEIVGIVPNGQGVIYQTYNPNDDGLITTSVISGSFAGPNTDDVIEAIVYDENFTLLNLNYRLNSYSPASDTIDSTTGNYTSILLDPVEDIKSLGFNRGNLNIQYNFQRYLFGSSVTNRYWIKDISKSRTEIRLASQTISELGIERGFQSYQSILGLRNYYVDFYLNFGLNKLVIANNAAVESTDDGVYLLIKLYEPLPIEFSEKATLWIVEKIGDSISYNVSIQLEAGEDQQVFSLRGPNFNIELTNRIGQTTQYYNYNDLFSSEVSSSMQKLASYYDDKAISINVDYSNFENFIHFSSAKERINNFVYKLTLIEDYNNQIYSSSFITQLSNRSLAYVSQSNQLTKEKIDTIIRKFDPYEYYLYYSSESFAWPKVNSTAPYQLRSVTSSQALGWLGGEDIVPSSPLSVSILYSASMYDATNKDIISYTIPQYLYEDPENQPMMMFLYMISQHFDNIWLYYKDVTSRYDSTNNPNTGISMDLVADALKSIGFNLYTNTSISDNLYYSLFGINADGSLLPPTGSELIEVNDLGNRGYVTSSLQTLSSNDIQKEFYKRLYHNAAYLYKTKGTQRGIKALIACYGIPEDILDVNEFGAYQNYTLSGLQSANNNKVNVVYQTNELSASVLSPYVTNQTLDTSYRKNSYDIEVAFSPSNKIDANISSSEGFIYLDDYIGNPLDQYKTQYPDLESYKNTYFATYEYPHRISEYIRLVKYYNNSLFKLIKDFVPARANVLTGIVVKSHLLERNKYARKEPDVIISGSFGNVLLGSISASAANTSAYTSSWQSNITTPSGSVRFISNQSVEMFTGQFSGSNIVFTTGGYLSQLELSKNYTVSNNGDPVYVNYGAIHNNITSSVRSVKYFNLDYSTNQFRPVNIDLVSESLNAIISASRSALNAPVYCNTIYPYAELQDSNYNLISFTNPRYQGSKIESPEYNAVSGSCIDKIVNSFAYLVDISTASIYLPNRSNAQIKFLIDTNQNVLDLTKANNHVFDVQNIFKSQQNVDIALFNYDTNNVYVNRLVNNPTIKIHDGGFKYIPILHNLSSSVSTFGFNLQTPIAFLIPNNGNSFNSSDAQWKLSNYAIAYDEGGFEGFNVISRYPSQNSDYIQATMGITASYLPDSTFPPGVGQGFSASLVINIPRLDGQFTEKVPIVFTPGQGYLVSTSFAYLYDNNGEPDPVEFSLRDRLPYVSDLKLYSQDTTSNVKSVYVNTTYTSQSGLYYHTGSKFAVLNLSDQYGTEDLYRNYGLVYSSSSDTEFQTSELNNVVSRFILEPGDKICLKDTASIGYLWNENYEFTVKSVSFSGSYNETGSRLLIYFDREVPINLLKGPINASYVDRTTSANYSSSNFIIFKKASDETNVILEFDPTDPTVVEEGLLYPQYISNELKRESGNIIKSLRAQNLIQVSQNP